MKTKKETVSPFYCVFNSKDHKINKTKRRLKTRASRKVKKRTIENTTDRLVNQQKQKRRQKVTAS